MKELVYERLVYNDNTTSLTNLKKDKTYCQLYSDYLKLYDHDFEVCCCKLHLEVKLCAKQKN